MPTFIIHIRPKAMKQLTFNSCITINYICQPNIYGAYCGIRILLANKVSLKQNSRNY